MPRCSSFGYLILLLVGLVSYAPECRAQPRSIPSANVQKIEPSPLGTGPTAEPPAKQIVLRDKGSENRIELGTWPDWAIVLFTGFLAWLSWRQYLLEKKLANDTRENTLISRNSAEAAKASAEALENSLQLMKAQLRAYVTVSDGKLTAAHMTAPFVSYLVISNGGQTPARNLQVLQNIGYRPFPLVGDLVLQPSPTPPSNQTLGPGTSMSVQLQMGRTLTQAELQALNAGGGAIFVWGTIAYDDFSGEQQTTDFRFFLGGDYGVHAGFTLTAHQDGNNCT